MLEKRNKKVSKYGLMPGRMDGWMDEDDRWMDGWMERQMCDKSSTAESKC